MVDILDKDDRYIDAMVRLHVDAEQWRVTLVYGEPRAENRHLMWSKLHSLKNVQHVFGYHVWSVASRFLGQYSLAVMGIIYMVMDESYLPSDELSMV